MYTNSAVDKLITACPSKDTWSRGEAYGPFGVHKDATIRKALYCVTPTEGVLDQFHKGNYDLLVSHHPFIVGVPQVILHTALDCCEGGLNDQWRDVLGMKNNAHFDRNLGWHGEVEPCTILDLYKKVSDYIGTQPIGCTFSDVPVIRTVAVCSGLGGLVEKVAHKNTQADCYIFGEGIRHPHYSPFKAQIEIGHTLSEHKPGLAFVRKAIPEVVVDGADMAVDVFGEEVYRA